MSFFLDFFFSFCSTLFFPFISFFSLSSYLMFIFLFPHTILIFFITVLPSFLLPVTSLQTNTQQRAEALSVGLKYRRSTTTNRQPPPPHTHNNAVPERHVQQLMLLFLPTQFVSLSTTCCYVSVPRYFEYTWINC